MRTSPRIIKTALWCTATVLLVSCAGSTTHFTDPDADLPYYERVGILPFASLANDRAAGQRVTSIFFTELLETSFAQVVEPNQFAVAALKVRGNAPPGSPWSATDLAKLQEETDVQAVFIGLVRNYEMTQTGRSTYPMVSLELRLVDTATGRMVWSASKTKREGPGVPLFNWGRSKTLPDLSARICRDLLRTLP